MVGGQLLGQSLLTRVLSMVVYYGVFGPVGEKKKTPAPAEEEDLDDELDKELANAINKVGFTISSY